MNCQSCNIILSNKNIYNTESSARKGFCVDCANLPLVEQAIEEPRIYIRPVRRHEKSVFQTFKPIPRKRKRIYSPKRDYTCRDCGVAVSPYCRRCRNCYLIDYKEGAVFIHNGNRVRFAPDGWSKTKIGVPVKSPAPTLT